MQTPNATPRVMLGDTANVAIATPLGDHALKVFGTFDGRARLRLSFDAGVLDTGIHVPAAAAREFARNILAYADLVDPVVPVALAEAA